MATRSNSIPPPRPSLEAPGVPPAAAILEGDCDPFERVSRSTPAGFTSRSRTRRGRSCVSLRQRPRRGPTPERTAELRVSIGARSRRGKMEVRVAQRGRRPTENRIRSLADEMHRNSEWLVAQLVFCRTNLPCRGCSSSAVLAGPARQCRAQCEYVRRRTCRLHGRRPAPSRRSTRC